MWTKISGFELRLLSLCSVVNYFSRNKGTKGFAISDFGTNLDAQLAEIAEIGRHFFEIL